MQIKILAAERKGVPIADSETPVDPTGGTTSPVGNRQLNYLGPNPHASPGPFFKGVFQQRMQQIIKFPDTGELYEGQGRDAGATGDLGSTSIEDMAINRLSAAGILQDAMVLIDGGHGWSIGLESRGPGLRPYIWTGFTGPNLTGARNTMIRFPYTPGTFTYGQIPGVQQFSSFGSPDPGAAWDWRNDSMVFLTGLAGSNLTFQHRKISEYKAGVDKIYDTIVLPDTPGSPIYQAFFTYQNSLFVYSGQANTPVAQPVRLTEYDWATGLRVAVFDGSNMGKVNGQYPGGWYEPEGGSLYDVDGTAPTAILGMTYYPYGKHESQLFTIPLRTQQQAIDDAGAGSGTAPIPPVIPTYNADLGARLLSSVPVVAGATLHPAAGQVLQCCVYVPALAQYFTSQAMNGTNGTDTPYQNTVISQLNSSGGLINSMTLHDSGHGTSIAVNIEGGQPVIYMNYQSLNNDLVSFTYTPGTYDNSNLPNMTTWPRPDAGYDNMQFDWDSNLMVMRNSSGTRDSYIRRKISEWKAGVDVTYGRIDLQQGPPTLQGFCTVNDALFRLIGGGGAATDIPDRQTYIQQYSWDSTQRVEQANYTSLGKSSTGTYPGGQYEPESVTMYREADGTSTVIFTVTFGVYPNHTYKVYKLPNIGEPVKQWELADPSTANQNNVLHSPLG